MKQTLEGKELEHKMLQDELEAQESLSTEMDFGELDFDTLTHTEHKRHEKPKTKEAKAGRPHKSTTVVNRAKVKNKTFTFTLPDYQKEALQEQAKKDDRSLSDYILQTLRNIRSTTKPIIKDKNQESKIVSITISISTKEHNELYNFSKKLNRKMSDTVKYVLKNPKEFTQKSSPVLKNN